MTRIRTWSSATKFTGPLEIEPSRIDPPRRRRADQNRQLHRVGYTKRKRQRICRRQKPLSERTRTTRSSGRSLRLIADAVETRKPWKCRTEESPENQNQVFRPSHRSWKSLRDSHIPTATVTTTYIFELKRKPFKKGIHRIMVWQRALVCVLNIDQRPDST